MLTILQKGGNSALPPGPLSVRLRFSPPSDASEPDVSAYVCDASGKVGGDADMVFYGQPQSGDGAVRLVIEGGVIAFAVDPARLRQGAVRIAFAIAYGPAAPASDTIALLKGLAVEVAAGGSEVVRFDAGPHVRRERAFILAELYLRDGAWKFRAFGQGFDGGLGPLSEHFGVDIAPEPAPVPAKPAISLSKISLDKERPRIDLAKEPGGFGEITVNLNWNRSPGCARAVDLDLGCLYELSDGARGIVQALGDSFGSLARQPFIELAGDDRTGAAAGGEWLRIGGADWHAIRRIVVYAFIYEGVPDWAATDAVVTLAVPGRPPVEVRLDAADGGHSTCAVALIENVGGAIAVTRDVRYFRSQRGVDEAYGFGLHWTTGRKD